MKRGEGIEGMMSSFYQNLLNISTVEIATSNNLLLKILIVKIIWIKIWESNRRLDVDDQQ